MQRKYKNSTSLINEYCAKSKLEISYNMDSTIQDKKTLYYIV